jgi:hypothetical protein
MKTKKKRTREKIKNERAEKRQGLKEREREKQKIREDKEVQRNAAPARPGFPFVFTARRGLLPEVHR